MDFFVMIFLEFLGLFVVQNFCTDKTFVSKINISRWNFKAVGQKRVTGEEIVLGDDDHEKCREMLTQTPEY